MKALKTALVLVLAVSCGGKDGPEKEAEQSRPLVAGEIVAAVSSDESGKDKVRHMAAGTSVWGVAARGDKVGVDDRVSAEANASAMIRLATDERISLNSGTIVKVLSSTSVLLEKGDIWVDGSLGGASAGITVKTEGGEVAMKGAFAGLRYEEKVLRTSLVSGSATVRGERGTAEIHGGQEAIVEDGAVRVVHVKDPGGLVSWTEGLRAQLERPASNLPEGGPEKVSGLGTMAAKAPGSKSLLPFEVLAQDVTVRIQDQVAITRIEQVFRNPTGQVVEGMYKFPVPAGARLNRYDMEIRGKLMQGEIVERQKGRAIMKTVIRQFVDMMRDPALVEWESGSTFKTRIFPIKAKEKKRIVLSYIQTLDGAGGKYHYVLPVSAAGADTAKVPAFRLDARVSASGGTPRVSTPLYPTTSKVEGTQARVDFEASDFRPMVDFVIEIDQPERPEATMATYGKGSDVDEGDPVAGILEKEKAAEWGYFMINLAPELPEVKGQAGGGSDWILLVDTSQSRNAFDMEIQKRLCSALIGTLGSADRVKVAAYDMGPRLMDGAWAEPSQALVERVRGFLDAAPPAGATNMADALMEAARHAEGTRATRVILMGDGAATLGENRPGVLSKWAGQVFEERNASVTTIGVGSSVDSLLFEEISRETGGRYHGLSSGEDLLASAVRIVTSLRVPVLESPSIEIEGLSVKDVHPEMLANLSGGEEVTLTGRHKGTGKLSVKLAGTLAGKPWEKTFAFNVGEAREANTFVPLVWASRKIDALTLRGDETAVKEAVELSKRFSLPSRYTSFIVLENDAMYREFKVGQTDDRLEWEGTDGIEYEEAEEEDDVLDGVGGIGTAGAGAGALAGPSATMGGAAKSAKPSAPAKKAKGMSKPSTSAKKMSAPEFESLDDPFMDGGGGGGYYYKPYNPKPYYDATIKELPVEAGPKEQKRLAELKEKVEKEPLVRKHRSRLIAHLARTGDYASALEEVESWRAMDSANPKVLTHLGDLTRLAGDITGAMRYYSGVLDIKPEDEKTMKMLASYLESKKRWPEAHAYRVSLNLLKPTNWKGVALRAVAAARAERWEDATFAAQQVVEEGKDGSLKLKKGVKLSKDLRDAVLRIAVKEKPPLLFDAPSMLDAGGAKFKIELVWEGDVNLDLWVATKKGKLLGGADDTAGLIDGKTGKEGEVFYMPKASSGTYSVQVMCAEPGGCPTVGGKVKIKAHGTSKTIPFVLQDGAGKDVATVRVNKYYARK